MALFGLAALAAALLSAASANGRHHRAGSRRAPARLAPAAPSNRHPTEAGPPIRSTSTAAAAPQTTEVGSPRTVAQGFAAAWLACIYHHGPCAQLPGALPAYATAIARQSSTSLATPAEHAAHPHVVALNVTRSCTDSAIATATYTNGQGERFPLHLNLVHGPAGWRVFDVAEAGPHIAVPKPLSHGPRAC